MEKNPKNNRERRESLRRQSLYGEVESETKDKDENKNGVPDWYLA